MPSRPWWYPEYWARKDKLRHVAQGWNRLPSRRRRPGVLSILVTLSIGAALAVLIVYPLLPEDAQAKILQVQHTVAEITPWLQSR